MPSKELPLSAKIAAYNDHAVTVPHEILTTWVGDAARAERERDEAQEQYSRCYSELVSTAKRLSLAERDLLDAQRERDDAQESLASIEVYASDTLSGRVGEPETVKWHRDAMVEVLGRAAGARLRGGAR